MISESFLGAQHGPELLGGSARLTMWVFGYAGRKAIGQSPEQ